MPDTDRSNTRQAAKTTQRGQTTSRAKRERPKDASKSAQPPQAAKRPAQQSSQQSQSSRQDLVSRFGSLEIDWPRSAGYFGGIALAVSAGLIDPPIGVFIAAIPFVKMLDLPRLDRAPRFLAQIFEGVAKPVGGDSQGTVRLVTPHGASDTPVEQGG